MSENDNHEALAQMQEMVEKKLEKLEDLQKINESAVIDRAVKQAQLTIKELEEKIEGDSSEA